MKAIIVECKKLSFLSQIRHFPFSYVTTWFIKERGLIHCYTCLSGGSWTSLDLKCKLPKKTNETLGYEEEITI